MNKPKMILFDLGQTLLKTPPMNGVKGTEAVLQYATKNRYNKTAAEIQAYADSLNGELGRLDANNLHRIKVEFPNHMFTRFLYEMQGVELSLSPAEIDRVFWDAAAPAEPTDGVEEFLAFLRKNQLRSAVITNICFDPAVVKQRIRRCLPEHTFEFVLASSEYMYRKPQRQIFELALKKADLPPSEVWFVGDQYRCDIEGAKNVGIFPIWYTKSAAPHDESKPDVLTIQSWKELQSILLPLLDSFR